MKNLSLDEKCYYKEIITSIGILIALFCYSQGYILLTWVFGLKAGFDFYCASKYAIKSIKEEQKAFDQKIMDEVNSERS